MQINRPTGQNSNVQSQNDAGASPQSAESAAGSRGIATSDAAAMAASQLSAEALAAQARIAESLPPPPVPQAEVGEAEASGAATVANFLFDVDGDINDPNTLVARFLKIVVLQEKQDLLQQATLGSAQSDLNKLAIDMARQMAKRDYESTSLKQYVNSVIDTKIEQSAARSSTQQDKRFERVLEGQMNGMEERSADQKKKEQKIKMGGGSGSETLVVSDTGASDIMSTGDMPGGLFAAGALDATPQGVRLFETRQSVVAFNAHREQVAGLLLRASENAQAAGAARLADLRF